MNYRSTFVYSRIVLVSVSLLAVFVTSNARSDDDPGCIYSEDKCPCAELESSGRCLKNQQNGKCALGDCAASYRCDCFGYEMCRRSRCTLYTVDSNALPSENMLFPCTRTADAGICSFFDHIINTAEAAGNALVEVSNAYADSIADDTETGELLDALEADLAIVTQSLSSVKRNEEISKEPNLKRVELDVMEITKLVVLSRSEALLVSAESKQVGEAREDVARLKAEAESAHDKAHAAEKHLLEEEGKAANEQRECGMCPALKAQVDIHTEERKDKSVQAGEIAKRSRTNRKNVRHGLQHIRKYRAKVAEIRERVEQEIIVVKKNIGI